MGILTQSDGSPRTWLKTPRGPKPMPVQVRGKMFPSLRTCAEHFGVTSQYVGQLIDAGRIDELGLLKRGTANVGKANGRSRPVTIDGVQYESVTAARKSLGLSRSKIYCLVGKRQVSGV